MSGLFRRKRASKDSESEDDQEKYLDLIATRVNDSDGNFFGEVVSADKDSFIIKHQGSFYSISAECVGNKFGDLMLASNIDLNLARTQGEQWRDQGKEVIGENKFYDFSEKRRLEEERNDMILQEMEKARELALSSLPPEPKPEPEPKAEPEPDVDTESEDVDGDGDEEGNDGQEREEPGGDLNEATSSDDDDSSVSSPNDEFSKDDSDDRAQNADEQEKGN